MRTEPYRRRSLAPGLVISLVIHAGLGALLLSQRPARHPDQPARWLSVSLLPAPPTPPVPEPPPAPAPRPPQTPNGAPRTTPAAIAKAIPAPTPPHPRDTTPEHPRATAAITLAPAAPSDPPDPFAAPAARPAGQFDPTAALQSARKLASAKAGKDDPAVAQLRDRPVNGLAAENELGKGIRQATRPDCLTSGAGAGILAPLLIAAQVLTDKKDHGCKW